MSEEHGSPRAGPGIGRRLQQAREARGLPLRRVEEITKIRARYLGELEQENFDVLPTVYVLGSLKTYADFLGLDGAALSRELKESLDPDEPEAADPDETDNEVAPAISIGFDHLFVGMGVVIVSVLALMTLVSAVARYEEPKISQINEPSVQNVPLEMALTGNVEPEPRDPEPRAAEEAGEGKEQTEPDRAAAPEPPKEDGDEGKPEEDEQIEGASSSTSLFGDVEFVPMSPSQGSSSSSASASASSSPAPSASVPAISVPSSAPSASPPPTYAPPASDSPASTPPSSTPPSSTSSPSTPSASAPPSSVSPSSVPSAGTSATPDDSSSPAVTPSSAASGQSAAPSPASVRPTRPAVTSGAGSRPVVGPTRADGVARGSGSVFSPQDVADAGRIRAGVDATIERSIPGR